MGVVGGLGGGGAGGVWVGVWESKVRNGAERCVFDYKIQKVLVLL